MAEISTGRLLHYNIEYDEPTPSYIYVELLRLYEIVDNGDRDGLAILKAFESADETIPTLSTELPICPDKLTSKLLHIKIFPNQFIHQRN
ncbi:20543_t:CDS:2 [Gigaspora margarita]|uniref:20543_t:CDS:1 n=1 Tax=Gigaspora margarita TaxID=4874 RepID=A0ABN7UCZ0_GIGMA|nr:20543_t:CDS:2 [Gigaspora margarita]